MSKGYEISTVMKIIVCLIAVGIVIFLVYKYVAKSPIDEQKCASLIGEWCSHCLISGCSGDQPRSSTLQECVTNYGVGPADNHCAGKESLCKNYIPGFTCS